MIFIHVELLIQSIAFAREVLSCFSRRKQQNDPDVHEREIISPVGWAWPTLTDRPGANGRPCPPYEMWKSKRRVYSTHHSRAVV